jgi:hypothetical protein
LHHHWQWDLGTPLQTTKQMSGYADEVPIISCHQKIKDSAISREVNADGVLGLSRSYPSTLQGLRNHSKKCKVFQHVRKWTETSHPHKITRKITGGCSCLAWQCSTSYCCSY